MTLHENVSGVNRGRTDGRMTRLCERAKWKKEMDELQMY
jgi:hypothetical protein